MRDLGRFRDYPVTTVYCIAAALLIAFIVLGQLA